MEFQDIFTLSQHSASLAFAEMLFKVFAYFQATYFLFEKGHELCEYLYEKYGDHRPNYGLHIFSVLLRIIPASLGAFFVIQAIVNWLNFYK